MGSPLFFCLILYIKTEREYHMLFNEFVDEIVKRSQSLLDNTPRNTMDSKTPSGLEDFNPNPVEETTTEEEPITIEVGSIEDNVVIVMQDMSPLFKKDELDILHIFDYENDKLYVFNDSMKELAANKMAFLVIEYIKSLRRLLTKEVVHKYGIQRNITMDEIRINCRGEEVIDG